MLTLPDFVEKQVLFVQASESEGNLLRFKNDNILYRKDSENIDMISCHKVFAIFIIGDFSVTTVLMRKCKEYGISIFFLKQNFEVYAEINSQLRGNYLLRERQYHFNKELDISKELMKNKAYNQLLLLNEQKKISNFDKRQKVACRKIEEAKTEKELLGIEGSMGKEFFKLYFAEMNWLRRMPRSKYDTNNVLLDIGYTFMFNYIDSLLNLYGFDTYKGIYHKLFFQRKSLSCDMIEPFRCLIDRQILKSFRLGQIDDKDFKVIGDKYVLSYDKQQKYLQIFFNCIFKRKTDIFVYVRNFYYYMMNGKDFPFFKIR